ncbi:MAG: mycofactocin biosynthesis peptidyl-dipeptidase MftE [Haloechinothrix sp.]
MNLGGLRSPQLAEHSVGTVLAVPLGATEQHGPHLPLDTDTTIAVELCRRLADQVPDVLVAPAVPYGSSGEHAGFPGTLSIGQRALELLIVELVRSADAFAGVVLVSGHGGNLEPLRAAVSTLRGEGRRALAWLPTGPAEDSHAGRTETSVMLRLRPGDVELTAAEAGNPEPLPGLLDRLREGGVHTVSTNGVLGDPAGASATEGQAVLDRWTDSLFDAVTAWRSAAGPG